MRKEIYKIKNPKHIVFGDPLYFEDFKGAELKRLTVDYKPPKSFDAARLVLLEKPNEKYPEYTDRTMTLYPNSSSAPRMVAKVLPWSCDNNPGTFSSSKKGGLLTAAIRAISKKRVPLVSSWNPLRSPAILKD